MLMVHVHDINVHRGKIADATNNGTKCASARMVPLTEENTCNDVSCPPFAGGKNNLKSSNAISQLLCSILYSVPVGFIHTHFELHHTTIPQGVQFKTAKKIYNNPVVFPVD